MSDDLIEDAIDCLRGEGWDNEADAVDRSVAEIKRLRDERHAILGVKTKEGLTASEWVLRTGLAERQLAAKDAEIESLQATLKYVDNLKGRYAILIRDHARDKIDLMANCNQLRDRCWKAEGELARWREIAIEERAKQMDGPCDFRTKYEWCDIMRASCDGFPHMWECCPNKDHWRSEAAKELNLQLSEDDDLTIAYMLGSQKANERLKVLQDALTKIREEPTC